MKDDHLDTGKNGLWCCWAFVAAFLLAVVILAALFILRKPPFA